MLRPYKFIVKAVPQIIGDDGEVIGEHEGVVPVTLFGCDALKAWADAFPENLTKARQEDDGSPA